MQLLLTPQAHQQYHQFPKGAWSLLLPLRSRPQRLMDAYELVVDRE
jgi:hypothetical protein